jgi:hypothetical protein
MRLRRMLVHDLDYVFRVGLELQWAKNWSLGTLQLTMKLEDILLAKLKD